MINYRLSNTGGENMNTIPRTIKNYELISNEIKFLPKSVLRLKILKSLYQSPLSMKELNTNENIEYSAISTNVHKLELDNLLYRKEGKYFLSNEMKLYMENLIELDKITQMLDSIFPILHNHVVHSIPKYSVCNLSHLENIELLEADGLNVYKTYDFIEESLKHAKYVNAILPFSYENFNNQFNELLFKNIDINLVVPVSIGKILIKSIDTSKENLKIDFFKDDESNPLLLICTDKKMILGLFKNDGAYDQNRLLVSSNKNSIDWANELFENFKKNNN